MDGEHFSLLSQVPGEMGATSRVTSHTAKETQAGSERRYKRSGEEKRRREEERENCSDLK